MDREEKIVVLAALLHDVGKAIQRVEGFNKTHQEYSGEFVRNYLDILEVDRETKEKVLDIVKKHHDHGGGDRLLKIVMEADRLSARFDRREYKGTDSQNIAKTPLYSIFNEIKIDREVDGEKYNSVVPLDDNVERYYPREKSRAEVNYLEIKSILENYWTHLKHMVTFKDKVNTLHYILLKAFKFVPSAVYKNIPDIPLYDHLKTTAAIALSLYRSDNETKPFLLIGGEISGIQKFIFYNLKSEEADRGAAKRYRGRSFMINLITDSVVSAFVKMMDLYEFSVIVNEAGHFLILAPNTQQNKRIVESISKNVNEYILDYFPEMYFPMVYMECGREDILKFNDTLHSFYTEYLGIKKLRKFSDILNENFFEEEKYIKLCPSCGRKIDNNMDKCEVCTSIEKIGGELVKSKYLARKMAKKENSSWNFDYGDFSISYKIITDEREIGEYNDWDVFSLKTLDIPSFGRVRGFKIYGSFVPSINVSVLNRIPSVDEVGGITLGFSEIVHPKKELFERFNASHKQSQEKLPKLAILKMDVDNLGYIFAKGVEDMSISRYSHLSFMINLFFAKESVSLARKYNIYLLFAGGDDLTAIGRYDEILLFAKNLNEKFDMWVSQNSNVTLSAGIAMASHKFPVRRLVEHAEDLLEMAKENGKNRIGIFGIDVGWKEFEKQLKIVNILHRYYIERKISAGFGHYLLTLYEKSKHDSGYTKEIVHPRPYLVYYLNRNFKNSDTEKEKLLKIIMDTFPYIKVGASIWALNRRYDLTTELEVNK